MAYLKELMNDTTIATGSIDSATILCNTVSKIYVGVIKVTNNFDPVSLFVTIRIGDTTIIPRISLEVLGQIWGYHEGGDANSVVAGSLSDDTQYGIDLGSWPVPQGSRVYFEMDNQDPESQIFNVSALVDEIAAPFPKAYGKSSDSNFVVDNLLECYTHDSAGDLESEANYIAINDKRVSVEQAYVRTCAEAINPGMAGSSTAIFSVNYQSPIPLDVEVKSEYIDSNPTTYYQYQVEDSKINAALKTTVEPMIKKQLASLSSLNKSALATRQGQSTPVGQPKRVQMR
jgi:hypothetical protein